MNYTRRRQVYRGLLIVVMVFSGTTLMWTRAEAALCVWRNPDADIKAFFGGGNYRTVFAKVGNHKATIEKAIGVRLDADETELKYWPIIKNGKRVGTVTSHLGKGDYGAIEVIISIVDPTNGPPHIKDVRIQRDRERYRTELRSDAFLNQFIGKTATSTLQVGYDIKTAHPKATRASQIIALSCKKLLVAYDVLKIANR